MVNKRNNNTYNERPKTRTNPQKLQTNHMPTNNMEIAIWDNSSENTTTHEQTYEYNPKRHW